MAEESVMLEGDELKNYLKEEIRKSFTEEFKKEIKEDVKNAVKLTTELPVVKAKMDWSKVTEFLKKLFTKKNIIRGLAGLAVACVVGYLAYILIFNGWMRQEAGGYKYYDYGTARNGYTTIDGIEFIFDQEILREGWVSYNGISYYQDYSNGIYKGPSTIGGVEYNLAADGSLTTGTVEKEDGTYLYDLQGYEVTGLVDLNGSCYFADEEGHIVFGWQTFDGKKYYFDPDTGVMAVGLATIEGKTYYFDQADGLQKGFVSMEDGSRYFKADGTMVTGESKIDGSWRLFADDGLMTTGFITVDDKEYYYVENDGSRFSGWMQVGDSYSYFDEDGVKAYGWTNIEGAKYYFDENGYMLTGWQELDGGKKYFNANGVLALGAQSIAGAVYLFDASGNLVTGDGWYNMAGKKYYRLGEGKIATGWQNFDNNTYYLGSDGAMTIGMRTINGNMYYFYNDGIMARDTKIDKYDIDANGVMTNPFQTITPANLDAYIQVLLDTYGRDTLSIFKYCRNNFWYKYREKSDVNSMACRMINNGSGACWDYAALCYKMLTAAGYNCQIVVGKGAYYAEHNWIIIETSPGVWRHMDPERQGLWVYMMTDAELDALDGSSRGIRYQWDHSAYPNAL